MKLLKGALLLSLMLLAVQAQAWTHGSSSSQPGKSQINFTAVTAQSFVNLFHSTAQLGFNSGATPAALDANQFPVRNFSGTIGGRFGPSGFVELSTTGPWTFAWDAGRSCFKIIFAKPGTASNVSSGVVVANGSGSGNLTVTGNCGQAGSLTINWNDTTIVGFTFDGTYTQWGSNTSGRMWMIRPSDQARFNNGIYWTPEAISLYSALRPEALRAMSLTVTLNEGRIGTNVVNWDYRNRTTAFTFSSFENADFPPGTRCGGVTSFCTMAVSAGQVTSAAAADTPLGGWVDGEQITGALSSLAPMSITGVTGSIGPTSGNCKLTVASTADLALAMPVTTDFIGGATECNTSNGTTILSVDSGTEFTINKPKGAGTYTSSGRVAYQTLSVAGKSAGAKLIWDSRFTAISTTWSGNVTFTYNATVDRVLVNTSGVSNSIPLEVMVQLSNLTRSNFWYTFPTWANDNFITNSANSIFSNLSTDLKLIAEWSNEVWNGGQRAFYYSLMMGKALGITPDSSSGGSSPFQSLRVRIVNGSLLPSTSWAGSPRLERVYCFQGGFGGTNFATGPMQGASLTNPGSAAYQSYVAPYIANPGTTGYGFDATVASGGNGRPIDYTESDCQAPYTGGGTAFSGQSTDTGSIAPTAYDAPLLNAVVAAWSGGDQAGAVSLIDQSIRGDYLNRTQVLTASGTTFTTPLAHNYSVGNYVRFTASGGSAYSGLDLLSPYQILSTPTSSTFTAGRVLNGAVQSAVNAGSAGTGTTSVGFLQGTESGAFLSLTIFGLMGSNFTKYQNMNATLFSPAPALGTPTLRMYETALEPTAPTTAQCAAISISSGDCAVLDTAVTGWKNSLLAKATMEYYFGAFKGTVAGTVTTGAMPNAGAPGWHNLQGPNIWALVSNSSFAAPVPYQTYYGFQSFSTNWLLKRDLDPASNDNDPMWLEKAA